MKGLIRSDFQRLFKDKLFLVICILAVVFAVITPLLYTVLLGAMDSTAEELLAGYVTAKGQFFSSFSLGNNLGLIAPLLIGIVLFKDFSTGTVRNKIISGHSRLSIFMSIFTVCAVALFGLILLHALLTLAISLPFFEYQATPFEMADFWYLLESLLFELLVYLFVAAFVSWLCVSMRNVGTLIVMYVAVVFGCTMVAGILQIATLALSMVEGREALVDVLKVIERFNVFNYSSTIGMDTSYTAQDVWYYVATPVLFMGALLGHGIWRFSKKDLK